MGKCCVEGCENDTWASGARAKRVTNENALKYCRKHCRWIEYRGSVEPSRYSQGSLEFRFWKHVEKSEDNKCWIWKAYKGSNGYGRLWDFDTKKNRLAHRVAYELATGVCPPDDMVVMHTCDNPSCVNPNHLTLGTAKENTQDMISKGRKKVIRVYGEENPVSKLTLEQAKYIKAHPEMKLTELAKMFGLSPNCIRGVRIGRTWRDA